MTAFVPSDTACLASSPGRMRRTLWVDVSNAPGGSVVAAGWTHEVWISREEMVDFLL